MTWITTGGPGAGATSTATPKPEREGVTARARAGALQRAAEFDQEEGDAVGEAVLRADVARGAFGAAGAAAGAGASWAWAPAAWGGSFALACLAADAVAMHAPRRTDTRWFDLLWRASFSGSLPEVSAQIALSLARFGR